ncbi:MAG: addiction module protein [Deltaproteobacteria bacterium]
MAIPIDTLLKEALALPPNARAELAQHLLESLRDGDFENDALQREWRDEIARRLDEYRSGAAEPRPWNELRSQLVATEQAHGD